MRVLVMRLCLGLSVLAGGFAGFAALSAQPAAAAGPCYTVTIYYPPDPAVTVCLPPYN
jgi:hypothetical protein